MNTKRSAAVFLMGMGLRKRLIAGLTKRFGYFGAPKYHAPAAESGKKSKCVQTIFSKGISTSYYQKDADPETSEQHEDLQQ